MSLSNKQRVFIAEYLRDFNATQAAIRAGYSPNSARGQGSRLLANEDISGEIKKQIEEKQMSADEVLTRLADIARGDMGNFMDISSMSYQLDLHKAKALGLTKLIKKVKQRTVTTCHKDGSEEETTTIEIEPYSALEALGLIGKYHKLFVDRHELTDAEGKSIIPFEKFESALKKIYGVTDGTDSD